MKALCLFVAIILIASVNAASQGSICSNVYDFIIDNYEYGVINYTTEQLVNLTNYINDELDSDLMPDTISEYVVNYTEKCYGYEELPASYLVEVLKNSAVHEKKDFWGKFKYEVILVTFICIGLFGFEILKNRNN